MKQRNMGSMIAGSALIVLGGLFLLSQFLDVSIWRFLWPLFVLIPGIGMFVAVYSGGKQAAGLAIPASIVSMVGLILLFQSITDHWESWAYAWSLIFPIGVGLGMYIYGIQAEDDETRQRGKGMLRTGVIIFVLLGVFFETIFSTGGSLFGRVFWPVAIILLGVYLIMRQGGLFSRASSTAAAAKEIEVDEVPSVHGEEESKEMDEG
jgi:predicted permease